MAVCRKGLRPVQHPMLATAYGSRSRASRIRSRSAPSTTMRLFSFPEPADKILVLLFLASKFEDVIAAQRIGAPRR